MTEKFKNPILPAGADPFVVFWNDKYYYVYSNADASVEVSCADNIHLLPKQARNIPKTSGHPKFMRLTASGICTLRATRATSHITACTF